MQQVVYDTWVLSDVELNLCAKILGYDKWEQIQISANEEALEKRMIAGMLQLVEKKFLNSVGDKYYPTKKMIELLLPIMEPDEVVSGSGKPQNVLYKKRGMKTVGVEELGAEKRRFRIYVWEDVKAFDSKNLQEGDRNDLY